jgi:hypothetical protein
MKIEPCGSKYGKFTEIATEGFTHPEHVIYGEWAPDSKWIAYTKKVN